MRMDDRAWAETGLLALIWGASFVTVAVALDEMGPLAVVVWRCGLGAAALWLAVVALRVPVPRTWRFAGACLVMGLLNNAVPFGLMAWAQQEIESGLTAILNGMTAVFAAGLAAALLPEERLTARRVAGIAAGLAGVAVIMGAEAVRSLDLRSLAQWAVLGGAMSYAAASVWGRVRLTGAAPAAAAAGMTSAGLLWIAPLALWLEGPPPLPRSPEVWAAVLWFGLLGTATAYLLYWRIIGRAGAANAMLVTLLIPPSAIVLGWVLLGEALAGRHYAGLGLIAAGLAVLDGRLWARLRRPKGARPAE